MSAVIVIVLAVLGTACTADDPEPTPLAGRSDYSQTTLRPGDRGHQVTNVLADEVIFWGGQRGSGAQTRPVNTGWHFRSATRDWRPMAPSPLAPRWGHLGFMHRSELYVIGGVGQTDGAAWNPRTNQWRVLPLQLPAVSQGFDVEMVWDGARVVLWHRSSGKLWFWRPAGPNEVVTVWYPLRDLVVPDLFGSALVVTDWGVVAMADAPQRVDEKAVRLWLLEDDRWRRLPDADFTADGVGLIEVDNHQWSNGELIVWNGDESGGATLVLRDPDGMWERRGAPTIGGCEASYLPARLENGDAGQLILARDFCGNGSVFDAATGRWQNVTLPDDLTADPPVLFGGDAFGVDAAGTLQQLALSPG